MIEVFADGSFEIAPGRYRLIVRMTLADYATHSTRNSLLRAGLARSAWGNVHRRHRPVGHGMIGRGYPNHLRGISRRRCAPCFLRKAIYFS
jgi:hypothetical protein